MKRALKVLPCLQHVHRAQSAVSPTCYDSPFDLSSCTCGRQKVASKGSSRPRHRRDAGTEPFQAALAQLPTQSKPRCYDGAEQEPHWILSQEQDAAPRLSGYWSTKIEASHIRVTRLLRKIAATNLASNFNHTAQGDSRPFMKPYRSNLEVGPILNRQLIRSSGGSIC